MKKKPVAIPYEILREKWMSNPRIKQAYDDLQPEFEIIQQIIDARVKRKISQSKLAERMGTGQAVISRLEGGDSSPSLSLLKRLAKALNLTLQIKFIPRSD